MGQLVEEVFILVLIPLHLDLVKSCDVVVDFSWDEMMHPFINPNPVFLIHFNLKKVI